MYNKAKHFNEKKSSVLSEQDPPTNKGTFVLRQQISSGHEVVCIIIQEDQYFLFCTCHYAIRLFLLLNGNSSCFRILNDFNRETDGEGERVGDG